MTLNPVLTIVNNALNNQGRPQCPDELWFYNAAFAYKLTTYIGYQLDAYNRFNKRWATLIWRGTEDQVVRDIPLYGPFLPLEQIDIIWGDIFNPPHTHVLDPLLTLISNQVPNGIAKGTDQIWYYTDTTAYKITNCSQKYCVASIARIANDIFGEWLYPVESGSETDVLKVLGASTFLPADQVGPLWGQLCDWLEHDAIAPWGG